MAEIVAEKLPHQPEIVEIGARMAGLHEKNVIKVRETAQGGIVVINETGKKFTFDAAQYAEALKNPRKAHMKSAEELAALEEAEALAAEHRTKGKKGKNA